MASSIIETPLATGSGLYGPTKLARTPDGALWFQALDAADRPTIVRTDPQGTSSVMLRLNADETIQDLDVGVGGVVWALTANSTLDTSLHLYKLTKDYMVNTPLVERGSSATVDRDGDVWVTSVSGSQTTLREFSAATAAPMGTPIVLPGRALHSVQATTDGALWLFAAGVPEVVKVSPDGTSAAFSTGVFATSIATGIDGNLWIGGQDSNHQPVVSLVTSDGRSNRFAIGASHPNPPAAFPAALASAPDGSVWYVDDVNSKIGRATVGGNTSTVPMPTLDVNPRHLGITSDGGSGVYYTDFNASRYAHLNTSASDTGVSVRARSFTAVEGMLSAATTIATFTTPDASAFGFDFIARYQIDGQRPHDGVVLSDGNGGYVVQAGSTSEIHTPGPHFLTVTIIDAKRGNTVGSAATGFAVATFNDLVPPVQNLTGTTAGYSAGHLGRARVATFTTSPMVDPSLYLAGIEWGTNHVAGEIVAKGSSYEVYASINFADWGTVPLTVNVTPVGGATSAQAKLDALITPAPITASLVPIKTPYTGLWGGTVASFTSFNTASKPSDYRAKVSSSDGGSWTAQVLSDDHGGFFVYASHAFIQDGSLPVTVTIDNVGAGGAIANAATLKGTAKVAVPFVTDFKAEYSPLYVIRGTAYDVAVATFVSGDPSAAASDFKATIHWGDGTITIGQVLSRFVDGGFYVIGNHRYADSAELTMTVTVDGQGDAVGQQSLDIPVVVAQPGLNVQPAGAAPVLNTPFKGAWARFAAPVGIETSARDFVAKIRWGEGTPETAAEIVSDGAGGYLVKAPHTFETGGSHTVEVLATWAGGWTIDPQLPLIFRADVAASRIWANNAVFSGQAGAQVGGVVASFVDAKPNDVNKYTATIDWADGTTTEGRVSIYDGGFIVYGTHAYATAGTYANVVTIKNAGAVSGVVVGGISITAAPVPIGTPGGGNGGGPVGSPTVTSSVAQFFAKGASRLLLTYSGAIDAVKARTRSRYKITEAGKDGKLGTKDDRTVGMRSIAYDSKTRQVIIVPKGAFKRAAKFRVKIQGESTVNVVASR